MRAVASCLLLFVAPLITARGQTPASSPDRDQQLVMMQYQHTDVGDLIRLYQTLTRFKIIQDNFVVGKVTLFIDQPVPRAQAIELIEKTLMINGYSLVQVQRDTVQIVGTGRNPRTLGLPTISDPKDLPQGERVFSFLFKLQHLDPTKVQQIVAQYLSPPKPYTSFVAVPDAKALWVTEQTSVIQQLIDVLRQLDVPPPPASPSPAKEG
jgi:general secretion pathway protein D